MNVDGWPTNWSHGPGDRCHDTSMFLCRSKKPLIPNAATLSFIVSDRSHNYNCTSVMYIGSLWPKSNFLSIAIPFPSSAHRVLIGKSGVLTNTRPYVILGVTMDNPASLNHSSGLQDLFACRRCPFIVAGTLLINGTRPTCCFCMWSLDPIYKISPRQLARYLFHGHE